MAPGLGGGWRVADEPGMHEPVSEREQRGLRLDASDGRAVAVVDAAGEAEVLVVGAVGVEAVRVGDVAGSRLPRPTSVEGRASGD